MLTLAAVATELLVIVFPGLVLHRALATRVLALDEATTPNSEIRETDLLVLGLLPGLAIASTIGTALALFGLLRTPIFAAVMIALVAWRWRDALATLSALSDSGRAASRSLARGELLTLIAILIFAQNLIGLLIDAQLPSANIDVWNHNFPLAQSLVDHSGFVFPQIPDPLYGSYPLFFYMLFAEGLLFVNNVIAAKVMNTLIYLSFLLSLVFCARRARALATVTVTILVINNPFFSNGASDAMTDVPRVCFSVLALVFAYRFLRDRRIYFMFAAGLLAGGAVGGKYTEMLTPVLIGASILPWLIARRKESWIAAVLFVAGFVPVACHPYIRNWIYTGNPIYPFFFGHPGLSDDYIASLFLNFDPAHRSYVTNLFQLQGWQDFFFNVNEEFLSRWEYSKLTLALIAVGLVTPRSYIIFPTIYTLLLGIAWYTAMFTHARWGYTAYLMMLTTAYLSVTWIIDRAVAFWEPKGRDWGALAKTGGMKASLVAIPSWLSPNSLWRAGLVTLALYLGAQTVVRALIEPEGWTAFLPRWENKEQARALVETPGGLDTYLARTRPGFQIYRYIGDHDLRMVFQPFDNGSYFYQIAYNGGRNGNWMVPWYAHPKGPDDIDNFLSSNGIKYFVYRDGLNRVEIDRLGPEHVEISNELFRRVLPRSRRLLVDQLGWELYAID